TGIPKINRAQLGSTLLIRPSLLEQNEISYALDLCDKRINTAYQNLSTSKDLFRILLHQLMTAQIRVDDLNLSALNLVS
ncbi:restriction endonuclease subunit S, partial [Trichormus variabilis]